MSKCRAVLTRACRHDPYESRDMVAYGRRHRRRTVRVRSGHGARLKCEVATRPRCPARDTLRLLLRCMPHCGAVEEICSFIGRSARFLLQPEQPKAAQPQHCDSEKDPLEI